MLQCYSTTRYDVFGSLCYGANHHVTPSFEGDFKNGLPEGSITRTHSCGRKDTGNFINGYFEGKIEILWHRHQAYQRFHSFEGNTKNGKIYGKGKLIYRKGSMIPGLKAQIDEASLEREEFGGDMNEPMLINGKRTLPNGTVVKFECGKPVEITKYDQMSSTLHKEKEPVYKIEKETSSSNTIIENHPSGIISKRPDYRFNPDLKEIIEEYKEGSDDCIVNNLCITRPGYGQIFWPGTVDIAQQDIDKNVIIDRCRVTVYIDDDDPDKPAQGKKLNAPAIIFLQNMFPKQKNSQNEMKDKNVLYEERWADQLAIRTSEMDGEFIDFEPDSGTLIFSVDHFTTYSFIGLNQREYPNNEMEIDTGGPDLKCSTYFTVPILQ